MHLSTRLQVTGNGWPHSPPLGEAGNTPLPSCLPGERQPGAAEQAPLSKAQAHRPLSQWTCPVGLTHHTSPTQHVSPSVISPGRRQRVSPHLSGHRSGEPPAGPQEAAKSCSSDTGVFSVEGSGAPGPEGCAVPRQPGDTTLAGQCPPPPRCPGRQTPAPGKSSPTVTGSSSTCKAAWERIKGDTVDGSI